MMASMVSRLVAAAAGMKIGPTYTGRIGHTGRMSLPCLITACVLMGSGCGGSANTAGSPPDASPRPPAPAPVPAGTEFNVTITSSGLVYVDKLEVEANRRRGIYVIYGFYQDRYDAMAQIGFGEIQQIDFLGPMPTSIFDIVKETRQDQALHREHCFETSITLKDGQKTVFYAWIPKLRGFKDFQQWEFSMNSLNSRIEKIEFDR